MIIITSNMVHTLVIATKRKRQVIDITQKVQEVIKKDEAVGGLCNIFVPHTSASIILSDFDSGTDFNLLEVFKKIIPEVDWDHKHDPKHTPDHILATLFGQSVTVPLTKGKLDLGTFQKVLLAELNGPRERQVLITLAG